MVKFTLDQAWDEASVLISTAAVLYSLFSKV